MSLYLPWWSIERLRRGGGARDRTGKPCVQGRPILLVRTIASRQIIAHACPVAVEAGVRAEMTLAHARALLPYADRIEPKVCEHDARRDRQGLTALARWAMRYVPLVAVDGEDGLRADITGCARLYRGEDKLLETVMEQVAGLGLTVCAAIAPTFGAAWALARYGDARHRIVERRDQIPGVLDDLPIKGLRLDEETIEALEEIGIRTIGQVLDVPRAQLPARFSGELLLRIDQALGRAFEPIEPVRSREPVRVEWPFKGPVTNPEAIRLAAEQLLERLADQLLKREAGVRRLKLTLDRTRATPVRLELILSRASRDARHLGRLLWPRLEQVNLGHGVEAIELLAVESTRLPHRQRGHRSMGMESLPEESMDEARGRLIDTLAHRLGHERVLQVNRVEAHLPERALRYVSASDQDSHCDPESRAVMPRGSRNRGTRVRVTSLDRPTQLLERSEPVQVQAMTPDGPVMQVRWRGGLHRVVQCTGPERLTSSWWREAAGGRDYFRVQVECGRVLWLYRDVRQGDWFLHGLWA